MIPQNLNYVLLAAGPTNRVLNQACETQLYEVTSNNPINVNPHAWGYSMPSQVAACPRMLGLQAWAVADATWSARALKILYSNELSALRAMNALVEPGGSRSSFRPVGHQRVLKVLLDRSRANFGAMHFVMVRPDGSVMEPVAGEDHASIDNAKTAVNMHGTGPSVFVQI